MAENENLVGSAANLDGGGDEAEVEATSPESPRRKRGSRAIVVAVVVVAVLVMAAGGVCLAFTGVLAPLGAAAKYGFLEYVSEDDTTDYVMTYKEQMGYGDADDSAWFEFLSSYDLTPERLRQSTVQQLVCDRIIEDWGRRLGIEIGESELDAYIQSMRSAYAFDDDGIWQRTLDQYGRTEDQLRETYRHQLVRQRVFTEEVPMPEPSDDQLREALPALVATFDSPTVKHSYCFKMQGLDEDGSLEKIGAVQRMRQALLATGVNKENFEALVASTSDVEPLKESAGGNGWSCDATDYGDAYRQALEETEVGGVSEVFNDGDGYAFIWIDEEYTLPATDEDAASLNLADIPRSLCDYLVDAVAYGMWEQDSQAWLDAQVADAGIILFEMPADVPYNVDMG